MSIRLKFEQESQLSKYTTIDYNTQVFIRKGQLTPFIYLKDASVYSIRNKNKLYS